MRGPLTGRDPGAITAAMRVLGLDVGDRRVGVAVSDPAGIIASPLVQFQPKGRRDLVAQVRRLVAEHGAGRVVVGLPLLLDGRRGAQARRVEGVVRALAEALEVPVETWDERFSTAAAEEVLDRTGRRRGRERRARRDMVAAAVILQAYLDAHRSGGRPGEGPGSAGDEGR